MKLLLTALFTLSFSVALAHDSYGNPYGDQSRELDQEPELQLVRRVYKAQCQNNYPLHTNTPCNERSQIGDATIQCASKLALDECRADPNADCVEVSYKVWEKSSMEFPGHKVCMASARVHGYGL